MKNPLYWLAISLIHIYQYCISPFIGPRCRFYPSCSHYTLTAIHKFGFFKGSYLSVKRLLKCHPLHRGGFDPVPDKCSTRLSCKHATKATCHKDTMAH